MREPFNTTCDLIGGPGSDSPGEVIETRDCRLVGEIYQDVSLSPFSFRDYYFTSEGSAPPEADVVVSGATYSLDFSVAAWVAIPSGSDPTWVVLFSEYVAYGPQTPYWRTSIAPIADFPGLVGPSCSIYYNSFDVDFGDMSTSGSVAGATIEVVDGDVHTYCDSTYYYVQCFYTGSTPSSFTIRSSLRINSVGSSGSASGQVTWLGYFTTGVTLYNQLAMMLGMTPTSVYVYTRWTTDTLETVLAVSLPMSDYLDLTFSYDHTTGVCSSTIKYAGTTYGPYTHNPGTGFSVSSAGFLVYVSPLGGAIDCYWGFFCLDA